MIDLPNPADAQGRLTRECVSLNGSMTCSSLVIAALVTREDCRLSRPSSSCSHSHVRPQLDTQAAGNSLSQQHTHTPPGQRGAEKELCESCCWFPRPEQVSQQPARCFGRVCEENRAVSRPSSDAPAHTKLLASGMPGFVISKAPIATAV